MSEQRQKLNQTESNLAARRKADIASAHRADRPHRAAPSGLAALPNRLWQAGNRAINRLLGRRDGGQPLAPQTKAEMERSFNADFSDVRVHQDSASQAAADSLNATAFARGDDIHLGADAPSPESPAGRELIAHELAHVVQQQEAGAVTPELSRPGDRFEQSADRAARQALQGRPAESAVAGAPPAIQRQQQPGNTTTREEAQAALESWLRRVMRQQGGRALRVTPDVKSAVTSLFAGDIGRQIGIEAWLNGVALPGDPAEFAREVARRLPEKVDRARIEALNQMSGQASTPNLPGRLKELAESSAPGEPEKPVEHTGPTAAERAERDAATARAITGQPKPKTVEPVSIDVLRAARIALGLPEAIRGPRAPAQTQPAARSFPDVERAIQQIAPDALVPAAARGTSRADSFANAQEVARDLARRLDIAQQQDQESVELRLGDNYNSARDRAAMIDEVDRIIQLIRDALSHYATNVKFVDVFFGEKLVTRGMARRAE